MCFDFDKERPPLLVSRRIKICAPLLRALHFKFGLLADILSHPERYYRRVVHTSKGKTRVCSAPAKPLAEIQRKLIRYLKVYAWPLRCYGTAFTKGSSIVRNAWPHVRNRSSWCLDLKDAFESVKTKHLRRYLFTRLGHRWRFFNDERELLGFPRLPDYDKDAAWLFSRLLTYRGRLRQGLPSSPMLFNFLMAKFDEEIASLLGTTSLPPDFSGSPGIVYTRYGDDLCFSSPEPIFPEWAKEKIKETIRRHHLSVNWRKTREGGGGIIEFPGVVIVRGRIQPRRTYVEKLKRVLAEEGTPAKVRKGHHAFLLQFPKGGRRAVRKALGTLAL